MPSRPTEASDCSTSARTSRLSIFLRRSGNATFWRTVIHGNSERLYSWNTSAMFPSASHASPAVGSSRPEMHLSSVVLPQPDGPTTQTNSPALTSNETSPIASTVP